MRLSKMTGQLNTTREEETPKARPGLLFWFLLIALLPCGILTAITARLANRALETSAADLFKLFGTLYNLESYAAERVRDGTALSLPQRL